ncbi:MAG TPA: hypothetical protein VG797_02160 [Phycisphaerales bacterium]|nr:hypothetical protein [Phycisphaerales bacterium]
MTASADPRRDVRILVGALIIGACYSFSTRVSLPGGPAPWCVFLIVAYVSTLIFSGLRNRHRYAKWPRVPIGLSHTHRINVIVTPQQAAEAVGITDDFFEPIVFPLYYASEREPALKDVRFPYFFKWLALCVFGWAIVEIGSLALLSRWAPFNIATFFIVGAVSRLPLAWWRPTYIRFVPGRMDIIQWNHFGLRPPRTISYDLRASKLRISARAISIRDIPPKLEWHTIEWSAPASAVRLSAPDRPSIMRAALTAALSTANPPRIPERQLTG